ncbi:Uncharacterised protein [Neisseria zoodegmatis]|uniref:Uncharacterized protein n=1 Tax=Neisseria zoodegmatis TaxID=326523 RepID=A0A378WFS5_9NEIS|nr:hypothetical protein [Neisseria zoodegmatis]SUA36318.1 Uncharacterised protein [Neisseria zoodegmatis]
MKKTLFAAALSLLAAPPVQMPTRIRVADKLSVNFPCGKRGKSGVAAARRAAKQRKARK